MPACQEHPLPITREAPFSELAAFLNAESISSSVLHGIDPQTGDLGRDLDLYVPSRRQAYLVADRFSEILQQRGVKWIALMHPIWGPRCIAIQESDLAYWELHAVTRISIGCIDFGGLFPIRAEKGSRGFNFDPCLWFIKTVLLKYSQDFIHCRPAWDRIARDSYVLVHKEEIMNEFQKRWSGGASFVAAALGPDTEANLRARRKGLLGLMVGNCLAHPANALGATAHWLYRKATMYASATVPVMGIHTSMTSLDLRACLEEKLGRAFLKVVVTDRPIPWRTRKSLQARQYLIVVRSDKQGKRQGGTDCWVSIPTSSRQDIEDGISAILDCVVQYNRRWSVLYRSKSSRRNDMLPPALIGASTQSAGDPRKFKDNSN